MKKVVSSLLTLMLLLTLSAAPAHADDVYTANDGDYLDPIPYHVSLLTGGSSSTLYISVNPLDDDGVNGCNLVNGDKLEIDINNSDPGVVSLDVTNFEFDDCMDTAVIELTPVAEGTAHIDVSEVSNTTSGTFNLVPAQLNVSVTDVADTTPPIVTPQFTPAQTGSGWNKTTVSVTWDVEDNDSDLAFTHNCGETIISDETLYQEVKCTAISAGGLEDETAIVKIDKTKPVISGWLSTANMGHNGWYNGYALGIFSCTEVGDIQSGLATDTVGNTYFSDGANLTVYNTGTCIDEAGNIANSGSVSGVNFDNTDPVIDVTTPVESAHYALNDTVLADWTVSDATSGIDTGSLSASVDDGVALDTSSPGNKNFTITVEDMAGNPGYVSINFVVDP